MDAKSLVNLVNDFGFPVVLAVLMMGFIWYMFKYVTNELKPKLGEANTVLIGLIDSCLESILKIGPCTDKL